MEFVTITGSVEVKRDTNGVLAFDQLLNAAMRTECKSGQISVKGNTKDGDSFFTVNVMIDGVVGDSHLLREALSALSKVVTDRSQIDYFHNSATDPWSFDAVLKIFPS